MAQIISGKEMATSVKEDVRKKVALLRKKGITPELTVLVVGNNPASAAYVRGKQKDCQECDIISNIIELPDSITEQEVLERIREMNALKHINGILVQLPLPKQIDEQRVIDAISPEKDVDGFTPLSVGKMFLGIAGFQPCTPLGVMYMLEKAGIEIAGKNCVVVGRSNIVGKPVALLLTQANGTVTLCHSQTKNLTQITKQADVLISAVGKANFITADMVKEGAAVVDVGINRHHQARG